MTLLAEAMLAAINIAAQAAIPAGTYTNLCRVAEADDLGGYTIKLAYLKGLPHVEMEECEGGCWSPLVSTANGIPGGITFVATAHGPKGNKPVQYVAKFSKNVLLLTAPGHPEIETQHLRASSNLNRRFDCEGDR